MTTQQTFTPRTPRASCRVTCVVAAVLVTLGGLRLLVAAETARVANATPAATVTGVRSVLAPEPVAVGVYRATTADFAATVEHTVRKIECVPAACGFPRVRAFGGEALDWTALEQRALAVRLSTPGLVETPRPRAPLVEWVSGSACGLGCPERLRSPEALTARF